MSWISFQPSIQDEKIAGDPIAAWIGHQAGQGRKRGDFLSDDSITNMYKYNYKDKDKDTKNLHFVYLLISCCQVDEWKGQEERDGGGRNRGRWERDCEYESGRNCESEHCEDERKLLRRREVLMGQLEEARWLKLNIEKRSKKVRLPPSAFSSVKMEVFILIHQRRR